MRRTFIRIAALAIFGWLVAMPVRAARQTKTTQPPAGAGAGSKAAAAPGSTTPSYDPFHAAQDVEVGQFYMHKGDEDAAIDRFKDAVVLRPDWAEPRLLLAEAYEKKHDKATALKYYKEYLQVFPNPTDRKKIEKKIEKLEKG